MKVLKTIHWSEKFIHSLSYLKKTRQLRLCYLSTEVQHITLQFLLPRCQQWDLTHARTWNTVFLLRPLLQFITELARKAVKRLIMKPTTLLILTSLLAGKFDYCIYVLSIVTTMARGSREWQKWNTFFTQVTEHKTSVSANRVLRRIFGPKRQEVTGG
jgi:hypothetical protein